MNHPRALLLGLLGLTLVHCDRPEPAPGAASPEGWPGVEAAAVGDGAPGPTDGATAGATGQFVPIARVEGFASPSRGEFWIRLVEPEQPAVAQGVALQSQELGYCELTEAEADGIVLYTVPEPGCEDLHTNGTTNGVPDGRPDDQVGCNDGNGNGAAFKAFDRLTCLARLPLDADDRIVDYNAANEPDLLDHSNKMSGGGVACALQHLENNTGTDWDRVLLDFDSFSGDTSQQPMPFPYAPGEQVASGQLVAVGTPLPGAIPTPTTGRVRPSELLGLFDFGPLPSGQVKRMWMYFGNGAPTDFSFSGQLYGETTETCNDGIDDDCDGVVDNGCKSELYGADCYADNDCRSQSCVGADIVSLAGPAGKEGTLFSDDVPGTCAEVCNDTFIEGPEQCEDGNASGADGCSAACTWEPGWLDDAWGPFEYDYGDEAEVGNAVVVDADGNTLIAGKEVYFGDNYWTIWKADPTGALDTSFGVDGVANLGLDLGPQEEPKCIGIQSDGKIILAGYYASGTDFAVARFDSSGNLDTAFGNGGGVTWTHFGNEDRAEDCAVLSDDRILVVGSTMPDGLKRDVRLVMYTADGFVDESFGVGKPGASGVGTITVPSFAQIAEDETFTLTDGTTTLVFEFSKDLNPVTTEGALMVDLVSGSTPTKVALDIWYAINYYPPGDFGLRADMFSGDNVVFITNQRGGAGSWTHDVTDPGFVLTGGAGGSVVLDDGDHEEALAVAVDEDAGVFVIAGRKGANPNFSSSDDALVVRFGLAGGLDPVFGVQKLMGLNTEQATGVGMSGGNVYLVGQKNPTTAFVAAIGADGVPLSSFGSGGIRGFATRRFNSMVMSADGTIIAVGGFSNDTELLMMQLSPLNGLPVTSFGPSGNGELRIDAYAGSGPEMLNAVVIEPSEDRIVAAGTVNDTGADGRDVHALWVRP